MSTTIDAERVSAWVEEGEAVKAALPRAGQRIMSALCKRIALREVARRTGLSPSYLSQVMNGVYAISPDAFLTLAKLLDSLEDVG